MHGATQTTAVEAPAGKWIETAIANLRGRGGAARSLAAGARQPWISPSMPARSARLAQPQPGDGATVYLRDGEVVGYTRMGARRARQASCLPRARWCGSALAGLPDCCRRTRIGRRAAGPSRRGGSSRLCRPPARPGQRQWLAASRRAHWTTTSPDPGRAQSTGARDLARGLRPGVGVRGTASPIWRGACTD